MTRTPDRIRDELLVLRCRDGDSQAFDELVSRWQSRLLGYAIKLTGRKDVALDAVQDTWTAIIKDLHRLEDAARFPAYAHRILARRCADAFRRQRIHRTATETLGTDAEIATPGDLAEAKSDSARVRVALGRLPEHSRVILALHYLDDLPLLEIARVLDVPEGTVKSRLHRARTALKRALETRSEPCPNWKT